MPKHILIVDDEDDIREVGQLAIEVSSDWQVHAAASGAEGLDRARVLRPDAILLDVMMPGMDGPTTLGKLRGDPSTRDIPVVFLTARVRASDVEALTALGAAGVLAKPFDPLSFAAAVAATLGWSGGQ